MTPSLPFLVGIIHSPDVRRWMVTCGFLTMLLASDLSAQNEFTYMKSTYPGWTVDSVHTIGYSINGYSLPGLPDGLGSYSPEEGVVRILVNHEMPDDGGSIYYLTNGTALRGARISYLDKTSAGSHAVDAGLAYHTIYDRFGMEVSEAQQLNEGNDTLNGIYRFCSGAFFHAGQYGLLDDIYFAGEEVADGQLFALDVQHGELHAVPWAGRAAFENITLLDPGIHHPNQIAMLICDDIQGAPLYLYLGDKFYVGDNSFLDRNGLAHGQLFVFRATGDVRDPEDFHGTGEELQGQFVPITHYQPTLADSPGYDEQGFATQVKQLALADKMLALHFSRPEDVHTSPFDATRAVFTSTGRGALYSSDDWGKVYLIDLDFRKYDVILAELKILYDGGDAGNQFSSSDFGIRNPDNVCWASNDKIYVQEDRATQLNGFGWASGEESSIWQIDPHTGSTNRIAQMNRSVTLPEGQYDFNPTDIGAWESSGIVEVSDLFDTTEGEVMLLAGVMAHSVTGGTIPADSLEQGGQLLLIHGADPPFDDLVPDEKSLYLFPNPADDQLHLWFKNTGHESAIIELTNADGQTILQETIGFPQNRQEFIIDTQHLASGMYIVQVRTASQIRTGRFVRR